MKLRPRRAVPAVLVAVVGLACCVLVAVVAVQLLLGERTWVDYSAVAARLNALRWADPVVAVSGGVVLGVGVVLLLAALLPGRAVVLPVAAAGTGVRRSCYLAAVRHAAEGADGVSGAKATLRRGVLRVTATTARTSPTGLAEVVRTVVSERSDQFDLQFRPRVRVRVAGERGSR